MRADTYTYTCTHSRNAQRFCYGHSWNVFFSSIYSNLFISFFLLQFFSSLYQLNDFVHIDFIDSLPLGTYILCKPKFFRIHFHESNMQTQLLYYFHLFNNQKTYIDILEMNVWLRAMNAFIFFIFNFKICCFSIVFDINNRKYWKCHLSTQLKLNNKKDEISKQIHNTKEKKSKICLKLCALYEHAYFDSSTRIVELS